MTVRRFYHSLRFKITVGVAVSLLTILTTISYLQYNSHRDLMVENLRLSASNAGDIIEANLHAMLILDLAMPDLDAAEVCRSVKANPASRHTKIPVLAESSQKDEVDEALAWALTATWSGRCKSRS